MAMGATSTTSLWMPSWDRLLLMYGTDCGSHCEAKRCQQRKRIRSRCTSELHRSASRHYIGSPETQGSMLNTGLWMAAMLGATLAEALHRHKTTERTLPVTRFGSKYGVRRFVRSSEPKNPNRGPMCNRSMRCDRFLMGPLAKASHTFSLTGMGGQTSTAWTFGCQWHELESGSSRGPTTSTNYPDLHR